MRERYSHCSFRTKMTFLIRRNTAAVAARRQLPFVRNDVSLLLWNQKHGGITQIAYGFKLLTYKLLNVVFCYTPDLPGYCILSLSKPCSLSTRGIAASCNSRQFQEYIE